MDNPLQKPHSGAPSPSPSFLSRAALIGGSAAAGAVAVTSLINGVHRRQQIAPERLPKALSVPTGSMKIVEGKARYYERQGQGVPIVLLHSINAAASSFEMKPLFDHFARTTERPVYALDWLGFGRSDRPSLRYTPELYLRQLRRFLSETVGTEADLVALSLAGEYAASLAASFPQFVRKLVLIAPTSLTTHQQGSPLMRAALGLADATGAFELFFHRLTRRPSLKRFYKEQIFPRSDVPSPLLAYAHHTSHVLGAHRAPRYFIDGTLFLKDAARRAYHHLSVPTLLVPPVSSAETVQDFSLLPDLLAANSTHMRAAPVGTSLLPHWETPSAFFNVLKLFLSK